MTHGLKKQPNGRYTWKYDKALRDQRRQRQLSQVDLWPAVARITAPTLIVRGAESDVFAPETAKRMHELIRDVPLVLDGAASDIVVAGVRITASLRARAR